MARVSLAFGSQSSRNIIHHVETHVHEGSSYIIAFQPYQPHPPQSSPKGGGVAPISIIIHGPSYNWLEFSLHVEEYCALPHPRRNLWVKDSCKPSRRIELRSSKAHKTISTRLTICDVVSYEDRQEPALYQTARNNQGHLQPGKESLTGK